MRLDVKKLSREELENLLVALTFDKSFSTYKKLNWSYLSTAERPEPTCDAINVKHAIRNGENIQKILAIFEENPTKEFRCKDLGEMIDRDYQSITPIIKRLYAKGLLERIVKEEIGMIPYCTWDNKNKRRVDLLRQAVVKVTYYKLAEEV